MNTLQREFWNGPPEQLRVLYTLAKPNRTRGEMSLWSHPLGFEVRLEVDGSFLRSQVIRDPSQIPAIADEWRTAMLAKGWR